MSDPSPPSDGPPARERKKRKWDQPAEGAAASSPALSVNSNLLPFAAMTGGARLPGMFPMAGLMPGMGFPPTMGIGQMNTMMAAVQQNAAAMVQKLNQELASKGLIPKATPPVQTPPPEDPVFKEIVINDAEPGIRYKLTKRGTQEEIQHETGAVVITRGRYRPPNEPEKPGGEKPLYLHVSSGINIKDQGEKTRAVEAAVVIIEEMLRGGNKAVTPADLSCAVYPNLEMAEPAFNLLGRIRGPNAQYIDHIARETGANVILRGRGSGNLEGRGSELSEPLHLWITCSNPKGLEDARRLAQNLIDTIRMEYYRHRQPEEAYQPPPPSYANPPSIPLPAPGPLQPPPPPYPPPYAPPPSSYPPQPYPQQGFSPQLQPPSGFAAHLSGPPPPGSDSRPSETQPQSDPSSATNWHQQHASASDSDLNPHPQAHAAQSSISSAAVNHSPQAAYTSYQTPPQYPSQPPPYPHLGPPRYPTPPPPSYGSPSGFPVPPPNPAPYGNTPPFPYAPQPSLRGPQTYPPPLGVTSASGPGYAVYGGPYARVAPSRPPFPSPVGDTSTPNGTTNGRPPGVIEQQQPQRRRFQEFVERIDEAPAPRPLLPPPQPRSMPPPPPRFPVQQSSFSAPPPPPPHEDPPLPEAPKELRASIGGSGSTPAAKVRLVDYGEEDGDEDKQGVEGVHSQEKPL